MTQTWHGRLILSAALSTLALAGCGGDDAADDAVAATTRAATAEPPTTTTAPPRTDPPATTALATDPPEPTPTTAGEAQAEVSDDELAQLEAVLADAIAPGSIRWDGSGVDAPPTAAVAAVRVPGREDVLVAVGENVDGAPAEAAAPFFVAGLAESLTRTVAFQLIDEGVLDPSLTVGGCRRCPTPTG